MAQFKRGYFPTCDAPCSWRPKTVTTPEIIAQSHELILEDRRISAKSVAEQLGISHERVGSIIHEDLDTRKLSPKWAPTCLKADHKRQRCQLSVQLLEFFFVVIHMISCRDWWPRTKPGYITMTRRQSNNQWSGGIAAHPAQKKFRVQKSAGKVLASIFLDQDCILFIIFQRSKLSTRSITHPCWCNWRTFWRKNTAGNSPTGSCSCTMLRLTGHLQPGRNWPTWTSNVLITHPILRIWPRRTTTCSLYWKNNWKVAIFRLTRRSLLPWRTGWTDNLLIFCWVACKVRATGYEAYWASWGLCWINPEFGRCSLFLSWPG